MKVLRIFVFLLKNCLEKNNLLEKYLKNDKKPCLFTEAELCSLIIITKNIINENISFMTFAKILQNYIAEMKKLAIFFANFVDNPINCNILVIWMKLICKIIKFSQYSRENFVCDREIFDFFQNLLKLFERFTILSEKQYRLLYQKLKTLNILFTNYNKNENGDFLKLLQQIMKNFINNCEHFIQNVSFFI